MQKALKHLTAFFLTVCMLISLVPLSAFADSPEEITVYFSLSLDGDYVTSDVTGDKMARVPITLSYFDLADYGLEQYYRYEPESDGGAYINDTIVQRPTVLHLYIKALEQYYLGRTYSLEDTSAMEPSGEPTSFYMLNFWGHTENLMYFIDHEYPLMDTGLGATADYVLLEDGMEVDVAMFTSYNFYNYGFFSYFANGEEITVAEGETVDFEVLGNSTNAWGSENGPQTLGSDLITVSFGESLDSLEDVSFNDDGTTCSITFGEAGTYYVVARDLYCGDSESSCIAPAITEVTVEAPVPTGEYEVTVKIGPSSANVKFYKCLGFNEQGYDILGDEITATDCGVSDDSYHVYTMNLDKGTYSFRAADAEGNRLGGMTFDVPSETEVDNIESKSLEIYLKQINVFTSTKIDGVYADETQYTTEVIDADGKYATAGDTFLDSLSRTVYPYMVYANGNAELYTINYIPTEEVSNTYNLGTNCSLNYSVSKGTTAVSKSGTLLTLINAVISAPTGSKVQVFNQLRNFYNKEVSYSSMTETDGIASYIFRLPKGNGNHTYRVSMENKITKAGYLKLTSEDTAKTEITFSDNENPKIRPQYDTSTKIGSRIEDNIVLNINPQNYLRMDIGDTFKARAYRAWQIVNSDTANIMIEPDFTYKIISGDSVTIDQQGQNAVLTAVKNGVSLIEVTYDAIEIGGNTAYIGIYGAIDPMRKGLFAVNVGGNTETEIILPEWDSDFDTVYFTGNSGTLEFKPTSDFVMTVTCNGTEITVNADGSYILPIEQGNNIVTVTAGSTTEYVVIKGNQVTVSVTNATSPDKPFKQGDTVNISFQGLHMPLPKFSGIYNPGFTNTVKASYSTENGGKVQSSGTQYDFISNHTISMTVYDHGTVKLTKGTIPLTSMGYVPGSHRELTDTGIGANFNASAVSAEFSRLPDISFTVLKNEDLSYLDVARENYSNLSKVEIMCGTSTYQKSFQFNLTTEAKASVKNNTATFSSINSEYPLLVTATPVNSDVTMEFRYWEAGDTVKHTAALTTDETLSLENIFSGEKAIYMEIAVTPNNPVYGEGEVYSYVVYKTTAGFTKPILKALNVKDAEGNAFSAPYGVLRSANGLGISYTQTDYICYIPEDAEAVTISVARLNGSSDITLGSETQNIGITETAFSVISVPNTETDVTVILADGATYTVKLIKADGVLQKKIISDGEIVAVSFVNTKDLNLDCYLASYSTQNQIDWISGGRKELLADDNTVYLSLSDFTDLENLHLFVWNENLQPIFQKSKIETE